MKKKNLSWQLTRDGKPRSPPPNLTMKWRLAFYGLLVSGSAITIASLPIVLYHFHEATVFGIVTNMVAIPLIDLVGMPLLLLKTLTLPISNYFFPMVPIDWAIIKVFGALHWLAVHGRGDDIFLIRGGNFSSLALFIYGLALYVFVMMTGGAKLSLPAIGVFLSLWLLSSQPLFLFVPDNNNKKWLARFGDDWVSSVRGDSFVGRLWQDEYGARRLSKRPPPPSWCDDKRCYLSWDKKFSISIIKSDAVIDPTSWQYICQESNVIIVDRVQPCHRITIIYDDKNLERIMLVGLWQYPTIFGKKDKILLKTLPMGNRPWR